ncbi:MAG: lipid-A-disaccharide synthase [Rhodobacterales bacterium]|nr:MAG: lipid-A-disaccharide synthase [Rhodobacterales bacterium]
MTRVFLVAGEVSGDRLGGALMAGLNALEPGVEFHGVGGPMMMGQGLESLFPMEELSVMGLAEVLPKYRHLLRRKAQTVRAVLDLDPDVLITIDAPDFGLRVAREVRAANPAIRTVHYVAPSVWAWRPGRAARMAPFIDQVLALLPFEPPYMEAEGMRCDFVGHPVVNEPVASEAEARAFRCELGVDDGELLLVLPGSRRGEVSRLGPRFGVALEQIAMARPGLRAVLPMAAPVAGLVREMVADWPVQPILLDPTTQSDAKFTARKRAAFRAADAALAASGTVSLELAAAETPMAIGYDFNWLTRQIVKRLVRVDSPTLVNLVTDTRTIPECTAENCTPECLSKAVISVLDAPETQRQALRDTMTLLGKGGENPGLRAARAVLDGLAP